MNLSKIISGVSVLVCLGTFGSSQVLGCVIEEDRKIITVKNHTECMKHSGECSWVMSPAYCDVRIGRYDPDRICGRMSVPLACKNHSQCIWEKAWGYCVNDRKKENKNEQESPLKPSKKS